VDTFEFCTAILGLLNVWSASLCFVDAAYVNVGGNQVIPDPGALRRTLPESGMATAISRYSSQKSSFAISVPAPIADNDARDVRVQKIV
jgi:hypothetical protein